MPDAVTGAILVGGPILPVTEGHALTADGEAAASVEALRVDNPWVTHGGSLVDARAFGDATEVDLDGRALLPGFVDAHGHPLMRGQCASWADLTSASDVDQMVKLLGEHALRFMIRSLPSIIRACGLDSEAGGELFGSSHQVQEGTGVRSQCPLEGWCELVGPVDSFGMHTVGAG